MKLVETLREILEVNEQVPDESFAMERWGACSPCGTSGCLIGNWVLFGRSPFDWLWRKSSDAEVFYTLDFFLADSTIDDPIGDIARVIGLGELQFCWLFSPAMFEEIGRDLRFENGRPIRLNRDVTRADALRRLRKAIAYYKRKAEIMADYEAARHREGDWCVLPEVSRRLAAAEAAEAV